MANIGSFAAAALQTKATAIVKATPIIASARYHFAVALWRVKAAELRL
jgi:hypothetical protein